VDVLFCPDGVEVDIVDVDTNKKMRNYGMYTIYVSWRYIDKHNYGIGP